jgi:hypothetical protein
MRKLLLIARVRWWALLMVGILGLAAGAVLANLRNDSIEPSFKAEAPIVMLRAANDESGRLLAQRLDAANATANQANESALEGENAEIVSEVGETDARLLFVGYGQPKKTQNRSPSSADYHLEADPIGVGVEEDLARITSRSPNWKEIVTCRRRSGACPRRTRPTS